MRSGTLIAIVSAAIVGAAVGVRLAGRGFDARDHWTMVAGAALFVVLSIYWAVAQKGNAPEQSSEAPLSRIIHQALVTAAFLLIVLPVPGLLARFLPPSNVVVAGGFVIDLFGLLLAIAARRELGRNWSAQVRIAEAHALVQTGPYRHVRHPIYSGALCMYAGLTLLSGTLHAGLGLIVVCLAYWRKITMEERLLQQHFGAGFDDYRRRSWAVVPRIF